MLAIVEQRGIGIQFVCTTASIIGGILQRNKLLDSWKETNVTWKWRNIIWSVNVSVFYWTM